MNPIKVLKESHSCLSDIKDSDLEYLSSDEILSFAAKIKKNIKIAVHGRGDDARFKDRNTDPYTTTDPLVSKVPSPGTRAEPAGSVDPSINTVGEDDYSGHIPKNKKIDDLLNQNKEKYLVKMVLPENQVGTQELAEQIYGKGAKTDGKIVYIEVLGEDEARHIMNKNHWSRKSIMEKV